MCFFTRKLINNCSPYYPPSSCCFAAAVKQHKHHSNTHPHVRGAQNVSYDLLVVTSNGQSLWYHYAAGTGRPAIPLSLSHARTHHNNIPSPSHTHTTDPRSSIKYLSCLERQKIKRQCSRERASNNTLEAFIAADTVASYYLYEDVQAKNNLYTHRLIRQLVLLYPSAAAVVVTEECESQNKFFREAAHTRETRAAVCRTLIM